MSRFRKEFKGQKKQDGLSPNLFESTRPSIGLATSFEPSPRVKAASLTRTTELAFTPFKPPMLPVLQNDTIMSREERELLLQPIAAVKDTPMQSSVAKRTEGETDPQLLYLITKCCALDELSTDECRDVVNRVLRKWDERSDKIVHSTGLFELLDTSTVSLTRILSCKREPNDMATAIYSDCLNVLSQNPSPYQQLLQKIRDGLFAAIYEPPVPSGREMCFQSKTWCSQVVQLRKRNHELERRVACLEAEKREQKIAALN